MAIEIWIILLVVIAAIGFITGNYLANLKANTKSSVLGNKNLSLEQEINHLKSDFHAQKEALNLQIQTLQKQKDQLQMQSVQLGTENQNLANKIAEQKEEFNQMKEQNRKDFELLANKILEEKSEKFTNQNKLNIESILNPLKEKIKDFEQKIEYTHKDNIAKNASLKQQIDDLSKLNQQITQETINLTNALKSDNKTQGAWGELVLARVLEKSGLTEGREYHTQQHFINEEGKAHRPDVVVSLPNNKKMIIDSKVSLTAYTRLAEAQTQQEKEQALKEHVLSINNHIQQLSAKKYEQIYYIDSPDFVLMFVPIEPAFAAALNADNNLYDRAFEKNIVIVTPTTLLATLRTVDSWWNNEKQQQNALEIAKESGKLYDQFVNLTDDLVKVGKQLQTVQGSYEVSMKKLTGKGNLITKIENIKKMGAKASKQLSKNLLDRADEDT